MLGFGADSIVIKHYVVNNQANKAGRQFLFLNRMFSYFEIIKYSNSNVSTSIFNLQVLVLTNTALSNLKLFLTVSCIYSWPTTENTNSEKI